jgi:hypothetical protein
MCPTANEAFFLLESQTFLHRAIKVIGSEPRLGERQLQPYPSDRITDETICLKRNLVGLGNFLMERTRARLFRNPLASSACSPVFFDPTVLYFSGV